MTVDDLLAVKSVADPQVSPDGKQVVYVVTEIDRATDKSNSDLWLVPLAGGEPKRLTTSAGRRQPPAMEPRRQVDRLRLDPRRLGAGLAPADGRRRGPAADEAADRRLRARSGRRRGTRSPSPPRSIPARRPRRPPRRTRRRRPARARSAIFDGLMIRHWSTWDEGKRSHLFVADAKTGAATDLIPKWTANVPPAPFGGSSDYAWSPDGAELAFTSEPLEDHGWSTNTDIWTVPASGGEPKNLTAENKAADAQPSYSPDGKFLAYVRQETEQYESDLWVLDAPRPQDGRGMSRSAGRSTGPSMGSPGAGRGRSTTGDGPRPLRDDRRRRGPSRSPALRPRRPTTGRSTSTTDEARAPSRAA